MLHFCPPFLSINIAVRIGFDPDTYSVNEGDGVVNLMVSVLEGRLDTEVVVQLFTSDDTAICKAKSF